MLWTGTPLESRVRAKKAKSMKAISSKICPWILSIRTGSFTTIIPEDLVSIRALHVCCLKWVLTWLPSLFKTCRLYMTISITSRQPQFRDMSFQNLASRHQCHQQTPSRHPRSITLRTGKEDRTQTVSGRHSMLSISVWIFTVYSSSNHDYRQKLFRCPSWVRLDKLQKASPIQKQRNFDSTYQNTTHRSTLHRLSKARVQQGFQSQRKHGRASIPGS